MNVTMNKNRLNAARMIAGELRNKRKITKGIVQSAIEAHMESKNPAKRIVDAIIEEAKAMARGTGSVEITERIVAEHTEKSANTTRPRRMKYKAGTRWGREERPEVCVVRDIVPLTSPKGILRVQGIKRKMPTALGHETEEKEPVAAGGTWFIESVPVFAYGGCGVWRGRVVTFEEKQKLGNGYGKCIGSLEFASCVAAGGKEGKPSITMMKRIEHNGKGKPLDPEEYYWVTWKVEAARKPLCVFTALGDNVEQIKQRVRDAMAQHLTGKVLCSSGLQINRKVRA